MAIGRRRSNRLTSNTSVTWLYLAASLCLVFAQCGYAAEPPLESQVEAAFLLNFTKFTEWPSSAFSTPGSPFAICILGNDPFGQALDQIVGGESVKGHPVTVLRLAEPPRPQTCQLVFLSTRTMDLPKILRELGSGGAYGRGPRRFCALRRHDRFRD